jgi:hypothetical protein
VGPKNLLDPAAAAPAAAAAKKPLALLFLVDDELRSHTLLRLLSDPGVGAEILDKVVWAKVPWTKDGEEPRRWKVAAPGAVVLLDPGSDPPKPIKTLRAAAPAVLRKELLDAAKAVDRNP